MLLRFFLLRFSNLTFFLFSCSFLEAQTTNIFPSNGFIGIGTTTPTSSVDARKNQDAPTLISVTNSSNGAGAAAGVKIESQNGFSALFRTSSIFAGYPSNTTILGDFAGGDIAFFGSAEIIRFKNNGQIGIGTSNLSDVNFKLFVEKGIRTRKIKVDQAGWPDYVFRKDYYLLPLLELKQFIHNYSHLPEVPKEEEIQSEGLDLGANQALLLKKIEELTLYVIQNFDEIEKLKEKNKELEQKNAALNKRLDSLR